MPTGSWTGPAAATPWPMPLRRTPTPGSWCSTRRPEIAPQTPFNHQPRYAMNRLLRHVSRATDTQSKTRPVGGGRVGTIAGLTLDDFAARFGAPHERAPDGMGRAFQTDDFYDGKVTALWHFVTPRGVVEVGDYWWNRPDELSVRAADLRAMRWFGRWARVHGLSYTGVGPRGIKIQKKI